MRFWYHALKYRWVFKFKLFTSISSQYNIQLSVKHIYLSWRKITYLFIECFAATFLHTHHSLLAKLGQLGWLMRTRLAWKKSQKTLDMSKQDLKHRECGQRTLPLLGPAYSEMGRVVTPWRVLGGVKSIPRWITYQGTVDGRETPVQGLLFCLRIIYNRPPSRPHQVAFYDMQGEECLILPRSSTGTLLLDLHPEGYTFAPFGSWMEITFWI